MIESSIQIEPLQALLDAHSEAFETLADFLIAENQKYNLTRITSLEQIQTRHFLDSLAAVPVLDAIATETGKPLRIIDVGSGAGFPSLVLAIVRPEWTFCSLEATGKKVTFQQNACKHLGLKNLEVIHGRAEEIAHLPKFREQFDIACARAVAAVPMLAELLLGFVRPHGRAIFWKGAGAADELSAGQNAIQKMGAAVDQIAGYSLDRVNFSLIICKKRTSTATTYPRVFGMIKKKPL